MKLRGFLAACCLWGLADATYGQWRPNTTPPGTSPTTATAATPSSVGTVPGAGPAAGTVLVPVTDHRWEAYWRGRWNPFTTPRLEHRLVPYTRWENRPVALTASTNPSAAQAAVLNAAQGPLPTGADAVLGSAAPAGPERGAAVFRPIRALGRGLNNLVRAPGRMVARVMRPQTPPPTTALAVNLPVSTRSAPPASAGQPPATPTAYGGLVRLDSDPPRHGLGQFVPTSLARTPASSAAPAATARPAPAASPEATTSGALRPKSTSRAAATLTSWTPAAAAQPATVTTDESAWRPSATRR